MVSQQDPPPAGTAIRSRRSAARQSSLRSHNLALVLETIARHGTISRADIAQAADLTRATVSSLTELLLAAGVLEWAPVVADGAVGRPASPVRLARGTWAGLGLEIGANHLCVAVVNLAGRNWPSERFAPTSQRSRRKRSPTPSRIWGNEPGSRP